MSPESRSSLSRSPKDGARIKEVFNEVFSRIDVRPSSVSPEILLERLVDLTISSIGTRAGYVGISGEENTEWSVTGSTASPERQIVIARNEHHSPDREGSAEPLVELIHRVVREEEPIRSPAADKVRDQTNHQDWFKQHRVLAVPLLIEGTPAGSLILSRKQDVDSPFTEADERHLRGVSELMSVPLQNVLLKERSIRDLRTGLYTHDHFQKRLTDEMNRSFREDESMSLLLVEVERDRRSEDPLGIGTSGELLKDVGMIIQDTLREYDVMARRDSITGRFGRDLFEVLLPEVNQQDAEAAAERLVDRVSENTFKTSRGEVSVNLNVGISSHPGDAEAAEALFDAAADALGEARRVVGSTIKRSERNKPDPGQETQIILPDPTTELVLSKQKKVLYSALSGVIDSGLDLDEMLDITLRAVVRVTRARSGYVITEEEDGLNTVAGRHSDTFDQEADDPEPPSRIRASLVHRVIETSKSIFLKDPEDQDDLVERLIGREDAVEESILCVPVRAGNEVIGAIYLENDSESQNFTDEDFSFVNALSREIASPLKNAREFQRKKEELQEVRRKYQQSRRNRGGRYAYERIVGRSDVMQEVFRMLDRISATELNVVIEGDTGTGKELAARAIHYNGPRSDQPFLAVNCARFSEGLLESELFGHVEGAFTGAQKDKRGLFEQADQGTLFLDEIGDMSSSMQAKLLRVLENGEVRRIGEEKVQNVDVRLICATNKRLKDLIEKGAFRDDLLYRLQGARVELPTLDERREDIPLLVDHFLEKIADEQDADLKSVSKDVMDRLLRMDWPGNVRELRKMVRRMVLFAGDRDKITETVLEETISSRADTDDKSPAEPAKDEDDDTDRVDHDQDTIQIPTGENGFPSLKELERRAIRNAIKQVDGDTKKAANMLGIARSTLYNKLNEYDIQP